MLPDTWQIEIIRSKRKTLSITVREGNVIRARAPYRLSQKEIYGFVESKQSWIRKQMDRLADERERVKEEGTFYLASDVLNDLTADGTLYFKKSLDDGQGGL